MAVEIILIKEIVSSFFPSHVYIHCSVINWFDFCSGKSINGWASLIMWAVILSGARGSTRYAAICDGARWLHQACSSRIKTGWHLGARDHATSSFKWGKNVVRMSREWRAADLKKTIWRQHVHNGWGSYARSSVATSLHNTIMGAI